MRLRGAPAVGVGIIQRLRSPPPPPIIILRSSPPHVPTPSSDDRLVRARRSPPSSSPRPRRLPRPLVRWVIGRPTSTNPRASCTTITRGPARAGVSRDAILFFCFCISGINFPQPSKCQCRPSPPPPQPLRRFASILTHTLHQGSRLRTPTFRAYRRVSALPKRGR